MSKVLLSVVIPVYKTAPYITKCVESCIANKSDELEFVLVDDGSPDNAPALCDAFQKRDHRIKVIHKSNGGLVSARKAGVEKALGEYISFVDSDDWVSETYFANILEVLHNVRLDIVSCGYTYEKNGFVKEKRQTCDLGLYRKEDLVKKIYPIMISHYPFYTFGVSPSVCSKAIKRGLIEAVQKNVLNSITLGEDAAVTYCCLLNADSMFILDENGYYYRQNSNSMTHSFDPQLSERVIALIDYMYKTLVPLDKDIVRQLREYSLMLTFLVIRNEKQSPDHKVHLREYKKNKHIRQALKFRFLKPYKANMRNIVILFAYKLGLYRILMHKSHCVAGKRTIGEQFEIHP